MKALMGALALLLLVSMSTLARADVLTLTPSQRVALPNVEGSSRILLLFDLTSLPSSSRVHIDDALLEWSLSQVLVDRRIDFSAHMVTAAWEAHSLGTAGPAVSNSIVGWELEPIDVERSGAGLVRFEIGTFLGQWRGSAPNYGILVATPHLGATVFGQDVANATLTIRYGYR